jgi:hypothetical protein
MDLYRNKSNIKIIILLVALVIGAASLIYTNFLVKKLEEREKKIIDLYAKALEYVANADLNENINFITSEIVEVNNSIPVILTDENGVPTSSANSRNISFPKNATEEEKLKILRKEIKIMREEKDPIPVEAFGVTQYIYYRNSNLIFQLKWYPYIQLTIIALFVVLAYLIFSVTRRNEQNRVWVGMAKETAHQLGTPLSSLMAWLEYFRLNESYRDDPAIDEIEKDIKRLEMITMRFSSIGSVPKLEEYDIEEVIVTVVDYLKKRLSSKVNFQIRNDLEKGTKIRINYSLFHWVIENICKNAVDAMEGVGDLTIHMADSANNQIFIDISDTGKGIPKSKIREIFRPGFTTKRRGWGLGLTLAHRIIEEYHSGRIFIKNSEVKVGTTFRIILSR